MSTPRAAVASDGAVKRDDAPKVASAGCVAGYLRLPHDRAKAAALRAKLVAFQKTQGIPAARYEEEPGRRRPQRRRLIGRARRGQVCCVCVLKLRHLAADPAHVAQIVLRLNVPVVAPGVRLEPMDPIVRWLAKQIDERRRRARIALDGKRARGERSGGIPAGFRLAEDGVHLVPDADEQRAIARTRELAAVGTSRRKIAAVLTAEGYCSRKGGPVTHATVGIWLAARTAP